MKKKLILFLLLPAWFAIKAQPGLKYTGTDRGFIFTDSRGEKLRITAYGDYMIRVQAAQKNEKFFSDDHYEMVLSHQWPGALSITDNKTSFKIAAATNNGITVLIDKEKLQLSFSETGKDKSFLQQNNPVVWKRDSVFNSFVFDAAEHFTGLGHGFFGRAESLDLKGQVIERNYGTEHVQQAPLLVPFYLSSKGYGIFVNSTFPNSFSFGKDGQYDFSLAGSAQMDFFVILGPSFPAILDRYTQLTGRARFPLKSFFGLALSDKGNDHTTAQPSDEKWWKQKITAHRNAGFPLDHIINDNRWRAGGGQRCISYFAWDSIRYPDPKEYEQWIKANGLITTLDFNRCIAVQSEGWKPSFNLPQNEGIDFNTSAPDFTQKKVRDWFWNLMWNKTLNPALQYPGDALWIDEFDEMGKAPLSMKFANGKTWQEMKNYWFLLIAKSLVQDGWDKSFKGTKRPFVWVRGMTAGAQRYATLWSGDINPDFNEMKKQIRGMQLAGLAAFPFWGHDAGGFQIEPDDTVYTQWSMAMGSFSPFWKPHGVGKSRWPLDRSAAVQKIAKTYTTLRYELMPYTYTAAHNSYQTGLPLAEAMLIQHPNDSLAWQHDLQYMWGNELLVAPNCSVADNVNVWLPKGEWYDYWNDEKLSGDLELNYPAPFGKLPLFVKAGSIIPMANFALSTAFIAADSLTIHVYTGHDGTFTLYEDDGVSENYKYKNESRTTTFKFTDQSCSLNIAASKGNYKNAPDQRAYEIIFHGLNKPVNFKINGKEVMGNWDEAAKTMTVMIKKMPVSRSINMISSTASH
ncbi:MAG: TIM-barrel domain-containing protein [Ferruginibacter sp.]